MAGIDATGFTKKDLQTIKTEIEDEFKNAFGTDIDVSESSVFGQIIGILSKKVSNIWELAQAVYASLNPDSSEGITLDRIAALNYITRLSASKTVVNAALYGTQGTIITTGSKANLNETAEEFEITADTTITKAAAVSIIFSVTTVFNGYTYQITINSTVFQFISDSDATAEEIIAGLKTQVDAGSEPVTFTDNLDGSALILADDGITSFSFVEGTNLQIDEIGSNGEFQALVAGSISAPANTLQNIVTPIAGWDSINNIVPGTTGSEEETDEELRIRRRENQNLSCGGTEEAIISRILQNVDGVSDVFAVSNRTNSTDGDGRPAKSVEMTVLGGTDQDVGDELWLALPAGIESYGNTTVIVEDSEGNSQTVKFTRPENVYIWLNIDITLYAEETFPSNGTEQVKEEIVTFAASEYIIGKDVLRERLYQPIFQVPGIASATITVATSSTPAGPPGSYTASDVPIDSREIAVFNTARITVGIV